MLIPVFDTAGTLHGLQEIPAEGKKKFIYGTDKKGHFATVGEIGETLYIAEGFATAASIHLALKTGVFIAFDAGNLPAVAEALHKQYPDKTLVICADNDQWRPAVGNTGVTQAQIAAAAIGGTVVIPHFTAEQIADYQASHNGERPTDFNDLHQIAGLPAALEQLRTAGVVETKLPDGFRRDSKGIWQQQDEDGKDVWVCVPLRITAATRDTDSDNHGYLLEFKDRLGCSHQWAMPLELLEDRRAYRKVLRRLGLSAKRNEGRQ